MSDTVQQQLAAGFEHHRNGRLAEAEKLYRDVLSTDANQPDALSLLGVLALQSQRVPMALELLGRCVQIAPDNFAAHNNYGEALRSAGRVHEAIDSYARAIKLNPNHPDAFCNAAVAFAQIGRTKDSVAALERATQLLPNRADLLDRLGASYLQIGDTLGAINAFRRAVQLQPDFAQAHGNLAVAFTKRPFDEKLAAEAQAAANRAIELAPQAAEAHAALGTVLDWLKHPDEAIAAYEKAASIRPDVSDYYGLRAAVLTKLGRDDKALELLEQGAKNCPPDPRLHSGLSGQHRRHKNYEAAVREAEIAVKLAPNFSDGHGNLSLALLSQGDYARGFHEYEWRWRCDNFTTASRDFGRPMWNGTSDLAGRTILIHTEQGFGDTLQFARYIKLLADAGATVIFEVHHALLKLMQRTPGVSRLIASGIALPDFDLHAPLLSLPVAFKTTLENVPRDVPYLSPARERADWWKQHITANSETGKRNVGLIWAGNVAPDRNRTVPGDMLDALAGMTNVRFFSLQRTDAGTYSPPASSLPIVDLSPLLVDFHETAAAMHALDVIVTIDTAGAHLAGAMGKKTLTMLPWSCDWRWLPERDQSVWYPTMRLFRQTTSDDWQPVLQRIAVALRDEVSL